MVLVKHGVGTRTVTHRGPVSAHRHDARTRNTPAHRCTLVHEEPFYLAKTGDLHLATSGDFSMAMGTPVTAISSDSYTTLLDTTLHCDGTIWCLR